jgi:hypothetical protein
MPEGELALTIFDFAMVLFGTTEIEHNTRKTHHSTCSGAGVAPVAAL